MTIQMKELPVITWELYNPENKNANYSQTISIPHSLFTHFVKRVDNENPMFIEVEPCETDKTQETRCLLFGNVETTIDDVVVIPTWAANKMLLIPFQMVRVSFAENIRKVKWMKVRADISDYAYWDNLKERLEENLLDKRAVSVGNPIFVRGPDGDDVEFYICELRDEDGVGMADGSIYEVDLEIDFDTPADVVEKERAQRAELERIAETKRLAEEALRKAKEEEERRNAGNRVGGSVALPNSREARAAFYERLYGNK